MSPWGLLTSRGRWLFVLGFGVSLLALYRGQRDLLWIGLLLLFLPLAALALVRTADPALSVRRELQPPQVPVGGDVDGVVVLDKDRDLSGGIMLFEEEIPAQLGPRPRFTLHQTAGHAHREFTYGIDASQRGRYRVGPLRVETRDALGLVRVLRGHQRTDELLVTPIVHRLPGVGRLLGSSDTGEESPQRLGTAGEDDVLLREYRHGDDMRRVHWKSSARHGELMVRREEQTWDPVALVVLDSRAAAHAGTGPGSSLEWAVSAAASMAAWFIDHGYRLHIVDASGATFASPDARDALVSRQRMLEFFTDTSLADASTLNELVDTAAQLPRAQVVAAVLGSLTPQEAKRVGGLRPAHGTALAILLDTPTFTGGTAPSKEAQYVLADAGWSTGFAEARSDIPTAWQATGVAA